MRQQSQGIFCDSSIGFRAAKYRCVKFGLYIDDLSAIRFFEPPRDEVAVLRAKVLFDDRLLLLRKNPSIPMHFIGPRSRVDRNLSRRA